MRGNDNQLQTTHCHLQCQMSPMKLVGQVPISQANMVSNQRPEPFLDNMIGLVSPYAGIHNLDLSPDSMSIVDGSQQIWGQLTPHDDSSFDSVPIHDKGSSAVRAYQSEAEMLVQKRHYSRHDRLLIGHTVPMPIIFISIHIYLCYRLQWHHSTKIAIP